MKSSYFITRNICTISINPKDITLDNIATDILKIIKKNKISNAIIDLAQFELITSKTINFITTFVNILKLNNIKTIVCGFNVHSASIIFHFIEDINFKTTLDVQSAINAIEHK